MRPVFLTWLIGVLVAVTLYRRHVRARLFRELSGVPAAELAARGDALRFELATIRALRLKSEDLQLIIVREAQPDTVVRVPFKLRSRLSSALSKAYPELWKRED